MSICRICSCGRRRATGGTAKYRACFGNGGHECLVVRVADPIMDAVGRDQFSAANDRHVAQRNIAVVRAASPASIDLALQLGYLAQAGDAEVQVTLEDPGTMEWLQL